MTTLPATHGDVVRVSQIQLLQPFLTLIASTLLLGERVDNRTFIFVALIMVIVALSRMMPINKTTVSANRKKLINDHSA
ncbi:MAG TPA: hypothetical protein ENJ32_03510 [Crenotrichaceae bacterium]|nr:hypothetical protein [Crenotrichaceae bacterium]